MSVQAQYGTPGLRQQGELEDAKERIPRIGSASSEEQRAILNRGAPE